MLMIGRRYKEKYILKLHYEKSHFKRFALNIP